MSRYRKTMSQAIQEGAIAVQILNLKKAYEPMRNKTISFDNAKKLQGIFDKFDSNKDMLKQLFKADIPFVSGMASARLISKHGLKAQQLMQIRKESFEKSLTELQQINEALTEGVGHISGFSNDKEKANVISLAKQHGLKVDSSGPKLKLSGNMKAILDIQLAVQKNGLKAEDFRVSLDEGRMSDIDAMVKDGKSAEEIAKLMKINVKVVKGILGEKIRIRPKNALGEEKDSEKKEKKPETTDTDVAKKDDEIALLKQKMETDKAKNVQKQTQKLINPETGEPLLQVGIAYKHLADKKEKEADKKEEEKKDEVKEDNDYLQSKLNSTQIANIKATWKNKKASDVTQRSSPKTK